MEQKPDIYCRITNKSPGVMAEYWESGLPLSCRKIFFATEEHAIKHIEKTFEGKSIQRIKDNL